ncbi:recombinase family protein [Nonomuraea dietziae]|uniref:recombinase family protein n=1 Tax=Nonomuraea dietziae TaxID=65515 RepID=UPI0033D5C013
MGLPDPATAQVVKRIFREYIAGYGIFAIAERLTADDVLSPSANDPERNRHRDTIAWSKYAVRAILLNPRYTGHQVWNKQRTDEVLLDVEDVALGHISKMRWNTKDAWIWSEIPVHEPLIDMETFEKARQIMAGRRRQPGPHQQHRARHEYTLRGCMFCGVCRRRMEGIGANQASCYRCRYPQEYAVANKIDHPRSVSIREDAVLPHRDRWIAGEFALSRIHRTVDALAAAATERAHDPAPAEQARLKLAECDRSLKSYKDTLDAGADPAVVSGWIQQTQAERTAALATLRRTDKKPKMTRDQISRTIEKLGDMVTAISEDSPTRKADLYKRFGLRAEFAPETRKVRASVEVAPHGDLVCVRGGT